MVTAMPLIHEVKTKKRAIAMTFDDGPHSVYTPQILEIFKTYGGKATFFMVGVQIINQAAIAKTVADQGHEIGNHTFSHVKLTELNETRSVEEIERTSRLIEDISSYKPTLLRPPYLAWDDHREAIFSRLRYKPIGALNVDALDWRQPGTSFILERTRRHIRNGSILIFHDGYGDRSQTVEAVRQLVSQLIQEGYHLVTVSELLKMAESTED
jgi:peptidoglycan/xylan/chitin deacetylase (PgdA/CDA1 family)